MECGTKHKVEYLSGQLITLLLGRQELLAHVLERLACLPLQIYDLHMDRLIQSRACQCTRPSAVLGLIKHKRECATLNWLRMQYKGTTIAAQTAEW